MVLADAEGIDAEPVGQHRLLDHLADDLRVRVETTGGAGGDIAKCIESEFHRCAATKTFFKTSGSAPTRSTLLCGRIGSIAECVSSTILLKSKRGAAISGASRATSVR